MSRLKAFTIVFCLVLAFGAFLPDARADEWNQKMQLTFSEPIEIPGVVLPAGTYWFVLADFPTDRDIMQVYSKDWSTIYATLLPVSAIRRHTYDHVEVRFAERPHQRPEALMKLFYPGFTTGFEFIYPNKEEGHLRRDAKLDIVTRPNRAPAAPYFTGS